MTAMEPFVRQVKLRHFRSVRMCQVRLRAITVLVGPNGSGKSNFLDGIHFVRDALRDTLEFALRQRGGVAEVRYRSSGHPTHFGIGLDLDLSDGRDARYAFEIKTERDSEFSVRREECIVAPSLPDRPAARFRVEDGKLLDASTDLPAAVEPDRLFLQTISGVKEFRPVYDGLCGMGFYNLDPRRLREHQDADPGRLLLSDGGNLAYVLRELERRDDAARRRVVDYLRMIVPGVAEVSSKPVGTKLTLEFREQKEDGRAWRFLAENVSDGTLRALAVLVAAFQTGGNGRRVPLVGIEEPEIAIHPGAAHALTSALVAASAERQIVLTTHSPDLLDHDALSADEILSVEHSAEGTTLAPIDEASRNVVRDRLYTLGELLRQQQLSQDEEEVKRTAPRQLDLFGSSE